MVTYSSKRLLKMLTDDGWTIKHQRGSHIQLVHPIKKGKVTIPHPKKDNATENHTKHFKTSRS